MVWTESFSNEDKSLLSTWRGGAVWTQTKAAHLLVRPSPELQVVWRSPSKCKTLVGRVWWHEGSTAGTQSGIRSANYPVVEAASYHQQVRWNTSRAATLQRRSALQVVACQMGMHVVKVSGAIHDQEDGRSCAPQ